MDELLKSTRPIQCRTSPPAPNRTCLAFVRHAGEENGICQARHETELDRDLSPQPSGENSPPGKFPCIFLVGAVGAFLIWSSTSILVDGYWSWRLAHHGIRATATVSGYRAEIVTLRSRRRPPRTYVFHMHQVTFHDRTETVKLCSKHAVEDRVSVLYVPEKVGVIAAAERGDSTFRIFISRSHGYKWLWLMVWIKLVVLVSLSSIERIFPGKQVTSAAEVVDVLAAAALDHQLSED